MQIFKYLLLISVVFTISCNEKETLTAQQIIDKAISKACNGACETATITFTFRDNQYKSVRNGGTYSLERKIKDSTGILIDVVSNSGLQRIKNETIIKVPDSLKTSIADGVNSVHYFAQLPYGLNDAAVNKILLGEATVNNEPYYKIKVTFNEEGGGTDYDDVFLYWIHTRNFTVDYLAYSYATNGGGIRFREAYNPREVKGIRFVDYNNYKPETLDVNLQELDGLFENNKLKLLSKIETENVQVTIN